MATSLISWQHKYGRHTLPWQQQPSPYHTWLSEIMLQQTQVTTAINYFNKFITLFPTIRSLALAHLDEVMALWAGLGYYSRARNLHQTAKVLIENHNGQMPNTMTELINLPGIGRSTAGAILALGHHQHGIILDGNVKRVLARYFGIYATGTLGQKILWQLSAWVTPHQNCATYTQAIMDLGAMTCTRSNPSCHLCPIAKNCYANRYHYQTVLPIKVKKPKKPIYTKAVILLINQENQSIHLQKRPSPGIWGELWSPPIVSYNQLNDWLQSHQLTLSTRLKPLKHVFTHQIWLLKPILVFATKKNQ